MHGENLKLPQSMLPPESPSLSSRLYDADHSHSLQMIYHSFHWAPNLLSSHFINIYDRNYISLTLLGRTWYDISIFFGYVTNILHQWCGKIWIVFRWCLGQGGIPELHEESSLINYPCACRKLKYIWLVKIRRKQNRTYQMQDQTWSLK